MSPRDEGRRRYRQGARTHLGRASAAHCADLWIRLTLDILGVPDRHVTGFAAASTARLALQRDEISLYAESAPGYRGVVEAILVKPGEAIPLYYDPHYNGETLMRPGRSRASPILPFQALYEKVKVAKPRGQLWDMYLTALIAHHTVDAAASWRCRPALRRRRSMALRDAVHRLIVTSDFAADDGARRSASCPTIRSTPTPTRQVAGRATRIWPEMRAAVAEYVKNGSKK